MDLQHKALKLSYYASAAIKYGTTNIYDGNIARSIGLGYWPINNTVSFQGYENDDAIQALFCLTNDELKCLKEVKTVPELIKMTNSLILSQLESI